MEICDRTIFSLVFLAFDLHHFELARRSSFIGHMIQPDSSEKIPCGFYSFDLHIIAYKRHDPLVLFTARFHEFIILPIKTSALSNFLRTHVCKTPISIWLFRFDRTKQFSVNKRNVRHGSWQKWNINQLAVTYVLWPNVCRTGDSEQNCIVFSYLRENYARMHLQSVEWNGHSRIEMI